jgi:hypothetical protein
MLSDEIYSDLIRACDAALRKFDNYFNISSDLAICATIIDPRLNLVYYREAKPGKNKYKTLGESPETIDNRVSHHHDIFKSFYDNSYRPSAVVITPAMHDAPVIGPALPFFKKARGNETQDELERYFNIPLAAHSTDPIQWWCHHKSEFPSLYKMAMDLLCIQSTSVASERSFSGGRQTITDFRCRLSDDCVRELQCLKSWFKLFRD